MNVAEDDTTAAAAPDRFDSPPLHVRAPAPPPALLNGWAAATVVGSAVAGAIHFALLPHHAEGWMLEGVAFGLVAALQVGVAIAVVTRPAARLLGAAAALAAIPALVWAWTVRNGLPIGPAAGQVEPADLVGVFTASVEAVTAVAAVRAAFGTRRPADTDEARHRRRQRAVAATVVAALGATSVALAGPLGAHTAAHAGVGHHEATGDASHDHDLDHNSAPLPPEPMAATTRAALAAELSEAREIALRYPTAADAEAAGYMKAGPLSARNGAHFINSDYAFETRFDAAKPLALLYADVRPEAPVVGLMYYTRTESPTEGFAGGNDQWHQHSGACFRVEDDGRIDVPLPVDRDVTRAMCDDAGGEFMPQSGWMVHVWAVPGWESDRGVFSHSNSAIGCPEGTAETGNLATGCQPVDG